MSEYIKVSEYCKASRLNKSKVYRAINSGQIITKKIDGVMYIDVENLPEGFNLPKEKLETEIKQPVKLMSKEAKTTIDSGKCEVISVEADIQERGFITIKHYEILQDLYNKLEARTQIALDTQEESIKILKTELDEKKQLIKDLQANKPLISTKNINTTSNSSESYANSTLEELHEKQRKITELENNLTPALKKIIDLEDLLEEKDLRIEELEELQSETGSTISGSEETTRLKAKLKSLEKALKDKQDIINNLQQTTIRDDYVTVLRGIANDNSLNNLSKESNADTTEKDNKISSLETELNNQIQQVKYLESILADKQLTIDHLNNLTKSANNFMMSEEEAEISDLKEQYSQELSEKESKIIELENAKEDLQYRITDLENALEDKESLIETLQKDSKDLIKPLKTDQEAIITVLQQKHSQEIDDKNTIINELQNNSLQLEHKISELENALNDKILELKNTKSTTIKPSSSTEDGSEINPEMIGLKDSEYSDFEKIKCLENLLENKQQTIYNLENQLFEKQQRILSFESGNENQREINNLQTELDIRQSKIRELENQLNKLKHETPDLENVSIDIQQRFVYYQNELDDSQRLINKLEEANQQKDEVIQDNKNILQERQQRIKDIQSILDKKQVRIEELEKELSKANAKPTEAFDGFEPISLMDSPTNEETYKRLKELEELLNKKDNTINELKTKLETNIRDNTLENDFETTENTDTEILNNLHAKEEEIKNLQTKLQNNKITIEELEAKLSETQVTEEDNIYNELSEKVTKLEEELSNKLELIANLEEKLNSTSESNNIENTMNEQNEQLIDLENDLKSKIEYIEMLETTLSKHNLEKESIIEKDKEINRLNQELQKKEEIISQLAAKSNLLEGEDDTDGMMLSPVEVLQLEIKELKESIQIKDDKIIELETLSAPAEALSDDEKERKIKSLELQVESLIDDINNKNQKIEEMEYAMTSPAGYSTAYSLDGANNSLELEKLKLAKEQAANLIVAKDAEIERLRSQLIKLQQELDLKNEDIKKERQKTISIALSKKKDIDSSANDICGNLSEDKENLQIKIRTLETESQLAKEKLTELEFENEQLKHKLNTMNTPQPQSKGGIFKKL